MKITNKKKEGEREREREKEDKKQPKKRMFAEKGVSNNHEILAATKKNTKNMAADRWR